MAVTEQNRMHLLFCGNLERRAGGRRRTIFTIQAQTRSPKRQPLTQSLGEEAIGRCGTTNNRSCSRRSTVAPGSGRSPLVEPHTQPMFRPRSATRADATQHAVFPQIVPLQRQKCSHRATRVRSRHDLCSVSEAAFHALSLTHPPSEVSLLK